MSTILALISNAPHFLLNKYYQVYSAIAFTVYYYTNSSLKSSKILHVNSNITLLWNYARRACGRVPLPPSPTNEHMYTDQKVSRTVFMHMIPSFPSKERGAYS